MISPTEMIALHLDRANLKMPIHEIETVCSFTGRPITEAVCNKDLIRKTFTDQECIRYGSGYTSIEVAMCMEAVVPSEKGFNSLRNYSFLVTEKELRLLKREEILPILQDPPTLPYILNVTYSNKKHTAYRSVLNTGGHPIRVTTDIGQVDITETHINTLLPVMQKWYSIIKGKEGTSLQPTHFTKAEILNGCENPKRIMAYGMDSYFREDNIIRPYRGTAAIKLLCHVLNKT